MKLLKIALPIQILIAIIIAVIFGINFPTKYKLTDGDISIIKSENLNLNQNQLKHLEQLTFKPILNKSQFIKALNQKNNKPYTLQQRRVIIKTAQHNPELSYIAWLGEIFIRALKMIAIPLIISSIITGITNIESDKKIGRIGIKTILYYLSTSILAIIVGVILVNIIQPGYNLPQETFELKETFDIEKYSISQNLIKIIPENIFKAINLKNILSTILFSILFGFFINKIEPKDKRIITKFFKAFFEVMMKITNFILKFTPLGVLGLIASIVAEQAGDTHRLTQIAYGLGAYSMTILLALGIHSFLTLPIILKVIGKVNPVKHLKNMLTPLLTAFSTSSSSTTLPSTIHAVQNKSGVSNQISGFTLPLGTTINMDGTAVFEAIAVIFIAQAYGFNLALNEQIIIITTSLIASLGVAIIPMAGLIMLSIILTAVDLPIAGIGLILAIDSIIAMFRTSTNVWSDSCAAVIIAKSEGEKLNV